MHNHRPHSCRLSRTSPRSRQHISRVYTRVRLSFGSRRLTGTLLSLSALQYRQGEKKKRKQKDRALRLGMNAVKDRALPFFFSFFSFFFFLFTIIIMPLMMIVNDLFVQCFTKQMPSDLVYRWPSHAVPQ